LILNGFEKFEFRSVSNATASELATQAKPAPPEPNGFVAHIDSALVQEVLDVAERNGNRMYNITASRIISRLVRK
jgi:hypothetical protein